MEKRDVIHEKKILLRMKERCGMHVRLLLFFDMLHFLPQIVLTLLCTLSWKDEVESGKVQVCRTPSCPAGSLGCGEAIL